MNTLKYTGHRRRVDLHNKTYKEKKNIDVCQSARSAQADMSRYFFPSYFLYITALACNYLALEISV